MKKITTHIVQFIKEDFNLKVYSFTALLMGGLIYVNYFSDLKGSHFSVEEKFNVILSLSQTYLFYFVFYFLPYFIVLSFKLFSENNLPIYSNNAFWLKIGFISFVLTLSGGFYFDNSLTINLPFQKQYLISLFVNSGHNFFTTLLPIFIYYYWVENHKTPYLYGLTSIGFDFKPYLVLLSIMVPFIYWASTTQDFQDQYPNISGTFLQTTFGIPKAGLIFIFEFIYLFDFINVELLMRGLMIIGMSKILGRHAVLPTVMVYLLLHFERSVVEAVGSIFGGYILSVLALRTNSILGGIMVHAGIAGLMELFAFWQKI